MCNCVLCAQLQCVVFVLQSVGSTEAAITAQNKDCYESGIVCMKYLQIYMGLTKIYFSDNSGKPVRSFTHSIGKPVRQTTCEPYL